jgi:hypothetical protein
MSIDAKIRPYTKLDEFKSEALHPADFTIRQDGVVRLNPGWQGGWFRSLRTEYNSQEI